MLNRRQTLVGLGLVASGCTQPTRILNDKQAVTIGGSLPLTGALKSIGSQLYRGLRLWGDVVGDRDGLAGRSVQLNIVDDEANPDIARDAYRSLVEDSHLLVSPYGSRLTEAVIEIIEDAEIPCIAHTAGNRSLWNPGRDWTVQMLNPVDTFLHPPLDAASRHGADSVSFIYRDDDFTPRTIEGAKERASQRKISIRDDIVYTSVDALDQAMRQILEDPPDVIIGSGFQPGEAGGGFLPDALALARAYGQSAGDTNLINWSIGASFPAFAERLPDLAELATGVTGWKTYIEYPGNAAFIERYTDQWGDPPDAHAAQGYATGQLFEAAADTASTLQPGSLRDALFELRTETVFGRYRVDRRGVQTGKTNVVVQWQQNEPVVVWPERWRVGNLVYDQ